MNTLRFSLGLVTLIFCGGSALLAADAPPKPVIASSISALSVGQLAPPIDVWGAKGMRRHLADFRGKRMVLLTFFPKCFTGNCANQVVSLRDAYPELQKMGVEVWAISTDSAEGERGQRAFAEHYKLPFVLVPDTNRKISMAYGAVQSKEQMAARMSVLVDKEGKVVWIDKQINPRTHGADVLAHLNEGQAKPSEK